MYAIVKSYHPVNFFNTIRVLLYILFVPFFLSCSNDEPALSESFLKIYDDSNMDVSYRPIDVVETIDGYIILTGTELSNTDFMGIRLLKIDEEGNHESDAEITNYVVITCEVRERQGERKPE